MTRRAPLAMLLAAAAVLLLVFSALDVAAVPAHPAGVSEERRVLVFAVPGLTWKDIDSPALPNLRALLDDSAVANLATRVTGVVAEPGEAYLTLGTGTRAVAPRDVAGMSFQADEPFGATTAADEHARQQGAPTDAEVVALGWTLITQANEVAEFGGSIGALGQALADEGVTRGVVANADGADPLVPGEPIHREAALGLADESGAVGCGQVSPALLVSDDAAPFGVRLDETTVVAAATRCSTPRSVVLVEASDLRRALAFRPRATTELAEVARVDALAATDQLLGALLEELDLERDAVVVLAPSTLPDPGLGVVGVRAAEVPAGYLSSGNTRRDGYVLLSDMAPSIAGLIGVELEESGLEGRTVQAVGSSTGGAERRAQLVEGESAALFRDRVLEPVVLSVVISVSVLALVAAVALLRGWAWARTWLERAALVLIALPSMTYLAALLPFHDWGVAAYWSFLVIGSLIVGAAAAVLRGRWLRPLVLAYGLVIAVVVLSVAILGSRLQVATVFGDSPIVAGRFTGINNVTFAFFFLAASVLACVAVEQIHGVAGRRLMIGLLGAVLLVDVAPMWGADVGGALAGVPAVVLLATGLGRWRVRWRTLALIGLATVALVVGLALLDLTRDSADRSHLGRLFERIGNDGSSGLTTVVERKLAVNIRSLTESSWRYIFGPLAIAGGLVAWRGGARVASVLTAFPALRRGGPGLIALAVLGYGANDSGIAVPAAMLASLVPGLVYLACRAQPEEPVA
ncbi:MAG: hypothetical protein ABIX10_08530 [Acidimicrobiales bacterium]